MTGKGGDGPIPKDDRGYVDPLDCVFYRAQGVWEGYFRINQSQSLFTQEVS